MSTAIDRGTESRPESLRAAVDRVLQVGGQPTAWSVIVTVLGDAVLPRGGRIWTGSLIEILGLVGFTGGVLRTALSRLVADGWVEGSRSGRRSFYELTARGRAETDAAARRIYRIEPPAWDGRWQVAILTEADADARTPVRHELAAEGFRVAGPETMLRLAPAGGRELDIRGAAILTGRAQDPASARALAARAWDIDALARSYQALEESVAPLLAAPDPGPGEGEAALAARILLVHELRRIVLRDPGLPAALLPEGWIGERVRRRIGARYGKLLPVSERWLGEHAEGADGRLPEADAELLGRRFAA